MEATMTHHDRLDITVERAPNPGLLRPTMEAALHGRALPEGPEATIARSVADVARAVSATPTETSRP
jgi:hypothetical protein